MYEAPQWQQLTTGTPSMTTSDLPAPYVRATRRVRAARRPQSEQASSFRLRIMTCRP